ncbi:hypothetical protein ACA910_015064 [Epithemia clementina (nom. ined.)]
MVVRGCSFVSLCWHHHRVRAAPNTWTAAVVPSFISRSGSCSSSSSSSSSSSIQPQQPKPFSRGTTATFNSSGVVKHNRNTAFPLTIRNMSSTAAKFHCVHVYIKTKPGTQDAFQEACLKNARNSAKEPGVVRFDVLQDQDDPTAFVLVEVYVDADAAPKAHKETAHYLEWRDTVADMMAEPRQARKFNNLFPTTAKGWNYPDDPEALE